MDNSIPSEYLEIKRIARRFVDTELVPLEAEIERTGSVARELRKPLMRKYAQLGLRGLSMPTQYGGAGLGVLAHCLLGEAEARALDAFQFIFRGGDPLLAHAASEELKQRYLVPLIRGDVEHCVALTEPGAGSDAGAIQTLATRTDGGFLLNGAKHFISNAEYADFAVLFAVTNRSLGSGRGISAFVVDMNSPGLKLGRRQVMMGRQGWHQSEIFLQDCFVPADHLIGAVDQGFELAKRFLAGTRIVTAGANCIGVAEQCLELSLEYAKQRRTFGKTIINHQAVQFMLADMVTDLHTARLLVYDAAASVDRGESPMPKASMVKLFTSEMVGRAADSAVQIHGGMGYCRELPIERIYRDARVWRIVDGTSEIQRQMIGGWLDRHGADQFLMK